MNGDRAGSPPERDPLLGSRAVSSTTLFDELDQLDSMARDDGYGYSPTYGALSDISEADQQPEYCPSIPSLTTSESSMDSPTSPVGVFSLASPTRDFCSKPTAGPSSDSYSKGIGHGGTDCMWNSAPRGKTGQVDTPDSNPSSGNCSPINTAGASFRTTGIPSPAGQDGPSSDGPPVLRTLLQQAALTLPQALLYSQGDVGGTLQATPSKMAPLAGDALRGIRPQRPDGLPYANIGCSSPAFLGRRRIASEYISTPYAERIRDLPHAAFASSSATYPIISTDLASASAVWLATTPLHLVNSTVAIQKDLMRQLTSHHTCFWEHQRCSATCPYLGRSSSSQRIFPVDLLWASHEHNTP